MCKWYSYLSSCNPATYSGAGCSGRCVSIELAEVQNELEASP
jgi:hypothetical protein